MAGTRAILTQCIAHVVAAILVTGTACVSLGAVHSCTRENVCIARSTEDDLTLTLREIVINNQLLEKGNPPQISALWDILQLSCAKLQNGDIDVSLAIGFQGTATGRKARTHAHALHRSTTNRASFAATEAHSPSPPLLFLSYFRYIFALSALHLRGTCLSGCVRNKLKYDVQNACIHRLNTLYVVSLHVWCFSGGKVVCAYGFATCRVHHLFN